MGTGQGKHGKRMGIGQEKGESRAGKSKDLARCAVPNCQIVNALCNVLMR